MTTRAHRVTVTRDTTHERRGATSDLERSHSVCRADPSPPPRARPTRPAVAVAEVLGLMALDATLLIDTAAPVAEKER